MKKGIQSFMFMASFFVVGILAIVTSESARAESYSINASLYRMDINLRLYEICGTVTGDAPVRGLSIDIEVDPGKHQGNYVTQTNDNGKFCQIIRVQGTRLNISIVGHKKSGVLVLKP